MRRWNSPSEGRVQQISTQVRQLEYYFSPANFGSLPLSIPATGSTAVGRFVHSLLL